MAEQRITVAAVVPAFNAGATIGACVRALVASEPALDEIVVVDDGSTDNTRELAAACGARVVASGRCGGGPGRARNVAAAEVDADIIAFVDSDVVAQPRAVARLVEPIARRMTGAGGGERAVVATFGSYTGRSQVSRVAGRYANLRHHDVHQRAGAQGGGQASTFWSGLGAVQREALVAAGGFAPRYGRPSIEDIELGARLTAAGGEIRIVPDAQGTHLKNWSVRELWRTDVRQRAVPWALMAVEQGKLPSTLNADWRGRVSAAALGVGLAGLGAAGLLGLVAMVAGSNASWAAGAAGALVVGLAGVAGWVVCEWSLLRLLWRHGARTLVGGALLHACYTIYAPATVVMVLLWGRGKSAARGRQVRRA